MQNYSTQEEKIIEIMSRDTAQKGKIWFLPSDIADDEDARLFVGYEASARLSDLAKNYPFLIDTRPKGRFRERRLKVENIAPFMEVLPVSFQESFTKYKLWPRQ